MKQPTDKVRLNLGVMLLVLVFFGLAVVYLTIVLSSHDFLWFEKGFSDIPARVDVYQDGQRTEYLPGQNGYIELAVAIRKCLNEGVAHSSGVGMGKQTLADSYSKFVTVEAFFDAPIKIHAPFDTGSPTQLLFPITGSDAGQKIVFLGVNKVYLSNSPALNNIQPLINALQVLNYRTE